MINLLNANDKKIIRAGRRNRDWTRYIFLTVAALGILMFVSIITFFMFDADEKGQKDIEAKNSQKNASEVLKTDALVENFSKNIQTLKTIENNKIRYSSLLVDIAKGLPSGCIMSTLSVSSGNLGKTPQTFEISCPTDNAATELKNSSKIFNDVQIISLNRDSSQDSLPIKINFNAIIQKPVVDGETQS
jgi:hypothetical protein